MKRNHKKLATVAIAFMLSFIMATAFALTAGSLTVGGRVYLNPLEQYVLWDSAVPADDVEPSRAGLLAAPGTILRASTATIEPARGRTAQDIQWSVTFARPGTATLNVVVENQSTVSADLGGVTVTPETIIAGHGMTADINFTDTTLAAGATTTGTVTVVWAPPAVGNPAGSATAPFEASTHVFNFTISTPYTASS